MSRISVIDEMNAATTIANENAELSMVFFETENYRTIRKEVFRPLEMREARLKKGLFEQKGTVLIGPAGSGKTKMPQRVIEGNRAIGTACLSVGR